MFSINHHYITRTKLPCSNSTLLVYQRVNVGNNMTGTLTRPHTFRRMLGGRACRWWFVSNCSETKMMLKMLKSLNSPLSRSLKGTNFWKNSPNTKKNEPRAMSSLDFHSIIGIAREIVVIGVGWDQIQRQNAVAICLEASLLLFHLGSQHLPA